MKKQAKTKEQKLNDYKMRVLKKFDSLEDSVSKLEYLNSLILRNTDEDRVEMLIGLVNNYKAWGY